MVKQLFELLTIAYGGYLLFSYMVGEKRSVRSIIAGVLLIMFGVGTLLHWL